MENEISPVKQAHQEMPRVWYERLGYNGTFLLGAVGFGMSYALTSWVYQQDALINVNLESRIAGALLCTVGIAVDHFSTVKALNAGTKVTEAGVHNYTLLEGNPLTGKIKSSRELYRNPSYWIVDALGLIASTAVLPLGVAFSIGKGCAALNNFRLAKRANRIAELALTQESQSSLLPSQQ